MELYFFIDESISFEKSCRNNASSEQVGLLYKYLNAFLPSECNVMNDWACYGIIKLAILVGYISLVTFDIKLAAWLILIEAIQQRASIHKIPIILYMQKLILWMQSCVEHKDLHKTLWNFIQTPNYSVVPPVTMITGCTKDTDWLLSLRFQSPSTFQYRKCSVNLWPPFEEKNGSDHRLFT